MFHAPAAAFAQATAIVRAVPRATGFLSGTPVETNTGWRPVGTLRPGDMVQTFDGGAQRVLSLHSTVIDPGAPALVRIPGGVLSNATALDVLPDQPLMVIHDAVEHLFDLPAVLVRARTLVGVAGIAPRPVRRPLRVVLPGFAEQEVLWANEGLLMLAPRAEAGPEAPESEFFTLLDEPQAARLAAHLAKAGPALRAAA